MKKIFNGILIVFFIFAMFFMGVEDIFAGEDNKWSISLIPYTWMVGTTSKVTIGEKTEETKTSFPELLKDMRLAGQFHIEARNGRFGLFIDPTYMNISEDVDSLGKSVNVKITQWLFEVGGLYRVYEGGKDSQPVSFDVLAGGRYFYSKAKITPEGIERLTKSSHFIDPIIGTVMTADLSKKTVVSIRTDVGGFGVGTKISVNSHLIFGYRLTDNMVALIGYKMLYSDYRKDDKEFKLRATTQGPVIGMELRF